MGISWRETLFSALGNLSSIRRPDADQTTSLKLFRAETIISAIVNCLFVVLSLGLKISESGKVSQNLTPVYISSGLLVLFIVTTQSYVWSKALTKTLFDDENPETENPEQAGDIELDVMQQLSHPHQHPEQEASRPTTLNHQISSLWLVPAMVLSLITQLGLLCYFGYITGRI